MQKKRILLVDDEPNIRVVLGAILQSKGYEVSVAEDGFAALRSIRKSVPDLIISDLRMPNMNGFELLAIVREKFPAVPVIAISGEFVGEQVEGPLADLFLQKGSYAPDEMLDAVRNLLAKPHMLRNRHESSVWAPTGDAPVMITCSECLKSFPLEPCDDDARKSNQIQCIFCDAVLQYRLIAITKPV